MIAKARHECRPHAQDEIHGPSVRVFTLSLRRERIGEMRCTVCGYPEAATDESRKKAEAIAGKGHG